MHFSILGGQRISRKEHEKIGRILEGPRVNCFSMELGLMLTIIILSSYTDPFSFLGSFLFYLFF